jgi:hypothetical protein
MSQSASPIPHEHTIPGRPPPSVARWTDPVVFLAVSVGTYAALRTSSLDNVQLALALAACVSVVACGLELASGKSKWPAIPVQATSQILKRSLKRWLGSMLALGCVLMMWLIVPEYDRALYRPLFQAMPIALPIMPIFMAGCILYGEWRLGAAADDAWQFGLFALGRWRQIDWAVARDGVFAWFIKGFFLPLNFCALAEDFGNFRGSEPALMSAPWPIVVHTVGTMIFTALLAAIVPGYLFGSRIFGNQVRSTDQSWFGWIVTLSCYPPLLAPVFDHWLEYHAYAARPWWREPWVVQTEGLVAIAYVLGVLIIFFDVVHFWGEAIFGLRASNLTNRGIITNGPYRFTKHPVYVAKCIGWFLAWLPPFAAGSLWQDARLSMLFVGVCGIYGARGWIEERLLSKDPVYVAYALWIDQHGLFRHIGARLPSLTFKRRFRNWP